MTSGSAVAGAIGYYLSIGLVLIYLQAAFNRDRLSNIIDEVRQRHHSRGSYPSPTAEAIGYTLVAIVASVFWPFFLVAQLIDDDED